VAFEKARRYAREIVPSFSAFAYFSFGIRAARWLANALYEVRTNPGNEDVLSEISPDATVIFVMNHRSNMDYVLVTYLAAKASALSYAVGEWARVWPLSRLIKSMGAYFIRRRSRGQLYRKVLARYVQMATQGGVTQAIFPEGGLSVNGKLMPLKMGLLSYVVEGFDAQGRDVVFVPVAINYDRVLEDRVLIAADQRGDRRFGARISVITGFILKNLWQRIRGKYARFGVAGVSFGVPLSLKAQTEQGGSIEALAKALKDRIADAMPVVCVPLLAQVFLRADTALSTEQLVSTMAELIPRTKGTAPDIPHKALPEFVRQALLLMAARGMIEDEVGGWRVNKDERALLEFYANALEVQGMPPPRVPGDAARAKS